MEQLDEYSVSCRYPISEDTENTRQVRCVCVCVILNNEITHTMVFIVEAVVVVAEHVCQFNTRMSNLSWHVSSVDIRRASPTSPTTSNTITDGPVNSVNRTLYHQQPRLIHKLSRREEIVLSRLRIGHRRLTHSYFLKREDKPQCIGCDTQFTVKHFLLECIDLIDVRRSCFQNNSLKDLFKDVSVERILSSLKRTNLFNKI